MGTSADIDSTDMDADRSGGHKQSDIYADAPYLVLPFDKLPQSSIVFDVEISNAEKAHGLYQKYIRQGADYEINISSGMRIQYNKLLGDKRKWLKEKSRTMEIGALADMFDKCIQVNLGLMGHSFVRFKASAEWMKVVESISTKMSIDVDPDDVL